MYINEADFACPCCGENNINAGFVTLLGAARERALIPFEFCSGYVCKAEGDRRGLPGDDPARKGEAAEIICVHDIDRYNILKALIEVRFNRFGLTPTSIYVDIASDRRQDVISLLPEKRNPG